MTVFIASFIRTIVPVIVGALASFLVGIGLHVPAEGYDGLTAFLFVIFTAVYYALIRLLEERFPQIGILLGLAKSPNAYAKGPGVELTSKPNGNPEITVTVNEASGMVAPPRHLGVLEGYDRPGPNHRAE